MMPKCVVGSSMQLQSKVYKMWKKFKSEMKKISRLPHDKNDFMTPAYPFDDYPIVRQELVHQLSELGFELLNDNNRRFHGPIVCANTFELQTHNRSVPEHTDDVGRGLYFAIFPVKHKNIVKCQEQTMTEFNFYLDSGKKCVGLKDVEVVVFNPRKPHSLIYYGDETTFMLFTVKRIKK